MNNEHIKEFAELIANKHQQDYKTIFDSRMQTELHQSKSGVAWLAVDLLNGTESCFSEKPFRFTNYKQEKYWSCDDFVSVITFPHGTIFRLIGRELTWEDEPVELTEDALVKPVTDEEIELESKRFNSWEKRAGWIECAKWMRERMSR
jgi:hypothetical protein